jgi:hypothetical protein
MSVKGYILLRAIGALPIPRHFRGLTGPYLFLSEAQQSIQVIGAATGIACQISTIQVRRILAEVVHLGGRFRIADVWNITSTQGGYIGEVTIGGRCYIVQRTNSDEVWHCVEQEVVPLLQPRAEAVGEL